jgi:hypothetical protein
VVALRFGKRSASESVDFGGAEGIRTLDLLDAIEARFQLRHGPTGNDDFYNTRTA